MKFEVIEYVGNFSDAMKEYSCEKLSKLEVINKYSRARLNLVSLPNKEFNLEISLDNAARVNMRGTDFYTLVVECVDRLFSQISRYKKHLDKKFADRADFSEDDDFELIAKEKMVFVSEMSAEEAIEEMEVLGHTFFVFKDIDRPEGMSVVYKRNDGSYGLLLCK